MPARFGERIAILAHEKFPHRSKTANGVLRYGDYEVAAVLDRENPERRVREFLPDVQDAPVVEGIDDVGEVDALFVGIAPIGGGFDESWRADVRTALERGVDVVSGLHYFLSEDEEFASVAAESGATIHDVRRPDPGLTVSRGVADQVEADVVLTVGTDCSVGKMTASLELVAAAREAGIDAEFVPTGQTGIMIAGWGTPVDRVVSDFTAGAVEEMVLEEGDDHDLLVVEGQGSIVHPAYSAVTTGILHGSMPDAMVLCHVAGREAIHGYEDTRLPSIEMYVDLYEDLARPVHDASVVAGALNTANVEDDGAAREAVAEFAEALDAPASDLLRFGPDEVLEALR